MTERSVRVLGWSTIVISSILILSEFAGLFISSSMGQIDELMTSLPQFRTSSLKPMIDIVEYTRIWSIYSLFYFIFVLAGAIQFVRFRPLGRKILELSCWIGLLNACADTLLSYATWKGTEDTLSSVLGGMNMRGYNLNPIGVTTIAFGFVLWILPSIGMIVYLRRTDVRALMKNKGIPEQRNSPL